MKTNNNEKRLKVKKMTIANLSDQEMRAARGGGICPTTWDCVSYPIIFTQPINQMPDLGTRTTGQS